MQILPGPFHAPPLSPAGAVVPGLLGCFPLEKCFPALPRVQAARAKSRRKDIKRREESTMAEAERVCAMLL